VLGIVENPALPQATINLTELKRLYTPEYLANATHLKLSGSHGEPTMAQEVIPMLKWVRSINPNILFQMDTNGSTRTPQWWRELAELFATPKNQNNYVAFNIDGLEDTNHIYRRRTVWKKIMENSQAFIDAGGTATWAFLVFEHNEHQVLMARKMAKDMGFTFFQVKISSRQNVRPIKWVQPPRAWKGVPARGAGKIQCMQQRRDELMLTAQGYFLPCPYIAEAAYGPDRPDGATEEIHEVLGDFSQYHASRGLDNVLPLFRKVSDRWATNPMRICQTECGGAIPARDQQYLKREQFRDIP
jgi:MoaA/NifB/PqqE/SkfB family radical SAM enzyme